MNIHKKKRLVRDVAIILPSIIAGLWLLALFLKFYLNDRDAGSVLIVVFTFVTVLALIVVPVVWALSPAVLIMRIDEGGIWVPTTEDGRESLVPWESISRIALQEGGGEASRGQHLVLWFSAGITRSGVPKRGVLYRTDDGGVAILRIDTVKEPFEQLMNALRRHSGGRFTVHSDPGVFDPFRP